MLQRPYYLFHKLLYIFLFHVMIEIIAKGPLCGVRNKMFIQKCRKVPLITHTHEVTVFHSPKLTFGKRHNIDKGPFNIAFLLIPFTLKFGMFQIPVYGIIRFRALYRGTAQE